MAGHCSLLDAPLWLLILRAILSGGGAHSLLSNTGCWLGILCQPLTSCCLGATMPKLLCWNEKKMEIIQQLQGRDVVIVGKEHFVFCWCFVRYQ